MPHKIIASFSIAYHQILNEASKLVAPLPQHFGSPTQLVDLYRQMVWTRIFDAKAIALQRTGKIGTYPSSLGQEAVFVSAGYVLEKSDILVPYYRDYGTLLMRGVTPEQLFCYWGGDERANLYSPDYPEDLPFAIPIASQCQHAAGIAYALSLRQEKRAVYVSCGDGATSQGDFYEALNFAATFKLPVVFLINNNQWAISVSRNRQTASQTLAQKGIAAGVFALMVDGNDPIALSDVLRTALDNARSGKGPTLIEAVTYRLCDHTTADDAKRYSPPQSLEDAWKIEPIARFRKYLIAEKLWDMQKEASWQTQCKERIAQQVVRYLKIPPQPATDMLDYMYQTLPHALKSQRKLLEKQTEAL